MKALIILIFLYASNLSADCTKASVLELAKAESIEASLKLSVENMELTNAGWCLVDQMLEKKINSQNGVTGLDEKLVLKSLEGASLEDLTADTKIFINYLISHAVNQNDIDETNWLQQLLNKSIIIENELKRELLEIIFMNASYSKKLNSHRVFDIVASINQVDKDKADFIKAILYTSVRHNVVDRNQLLDQLARSAIKGQDFIDSIGEDKIKLLAVLLLGERSGNQVLEQPLYQYITQLILLQEETYLCIGTRLVKYLHADNKPSYLATNQVNQVLEMAEDGTCPDKNLLSRADIDQHIAAQLALAEVEYNNRFSNKQIISLHD